MTAPGWYNGRKKLVEGDVLSFNYVRRIILSDGEEYMVFEDPFGIRHMVQYIHYKNYGIEPGMEVKCRVDRINCTGRVFLEPEHPFWEVGKIAGFQVRSVTKIRNNDSETTLITVSDFSGNDIGCELLNPSVCNVKAGEKVEFRIENIKKGKPILSIV